MKLNLCIFLAITLFGSVSQSFTQEPPTEPAAVVAKVTEAARALVNTFDEAQQKKLLFSFDDQAQRRNWSNLPVGSVPRKGLRWGDLNETQQQAIWQLLTATLSPKGVQQIVDNMGGDEILKNRGNGGGGRGGSRGPDFGKDAYYISILGTPSTTEPWMWQFGGHHLGVNATIVGDQITLSPTLTGGQPVNYELDGRKIRQLAEEQSKAFEFIGTLTTEQRKIAAVDDQPRMNLAFGPGSDGAKTTQEGINVSTLDQSQQALLLDLIQTRVGLLNDVHAAVAMEKIAKRLDETWFVWFGPTKPGGASAYRIQGPTVVIEYAPQQLGGDLSEHTHAMYRDPTNDYGAGSIAAKK